VGVSINSVVLAGHLTKDPDLRSTAGGDSVCGLRIAVNGSEKQNGQWVDRPDFFNVRVWGRQADSCAEHLRKGSLIGVSGRLRMEEWTPKDGGDKRYDTLVVARDVQFLDRKGDGGGGHRSAADVPDATFVVPDADFSTGADDDIPF
jgi:single-strand DNA-binding protein